MSIKQKIKDILKNKRIIACINHINVNNHIWIKHNDIINHGMLFKNVKILLQIT